MPALTFDDIEPVRKGALTFDDLPDAGEDMGFLAKIGASPLGQAIGSAIDETSGIIKNIPNQNPASSGLQIIGQGAKMAAQPFAQAISAATPDFIPQGAKMAANTIDSTGAGQWIGDKLLQAKNIAQAHPEITADIGAAINIAGTLQGGKAATNAVGKAAPIVRNAVNKFESASQNLPSILGDTKSGVSVNAALGGVPNYVENRAIGAFARHGDRLKAASDTLKSQSTPIYNAVDKAGGRINPFGAKKVLSSIDEAIGPADEILDGPTLSLFNKMQKSIGSGDVSITKLDKWRRKFSAIADDTRKPLMEGGGLTEEGRTAVMAVKGIDKAMKSLDASDFAKGGPEIIEALHTARAYSARSQSFDRIARLLARTEGDPARTRAAFARMVRDNKLTGLTQEEASIAKQASKWTTSEMLERGLGTFGIDLGIRKNVALPGLGLAAGATVAPQAIPVIAAGTAARQLSKYAGRAGGEKLLRAIENRPIPGSDIYGSLPKDISKVTMQEIGQMPPAQARLLLEQIKAARRKP